MFKTPHVLANVVHMGNERFFVSSSGSRPDLRNGWKVKQIEVSGGQWNDWSSRNPQPQSEPRVLLRTSETAKPATTYNDRLTKLVLTHPNTSCAKAIEEAF